MKDYIKELNIIDFLGIIAPGCLLVLIITGDNTTLMLWPDYFGGDATVFVKGLFLLIAGYLAGMILHELGDLIEKGVWSIHSLDPKAYAANAVGPKEIEDAMVSAGILDESRVKKQSAPIVHTKLKGVLGSIAALIILFSSSVGFCLAMRTSCNVNRSSRMFSLSLASYVAIISLILSCIGTIFILNLFLIKKYTKKQGSTEAETSQWNCIRNICTLNPNIQTYLALHGSHSKQDMFDSFRHVMRNMLICIAIVNVYSIWHPVDIYLDIANYVIGRSNVHQDFLLLSVCFTLVIIMMFSRYVHFAFLRYKYGFEIFIEIVKEQARPKEESSQTFYVHIIEDNSSTDNGVLYQKQQKNNTQRTPVEKA